MIPALIKKVSAVPKKAQNGCHAIVAVGIDLSCLSPTTKQSKHKYLLGLGVNGVHVEGSIQQ